jgi:hypothetical protein
MAATARARIERLENQARPASRMTLALESLSDDDLAFIESIGAKCPPGRDGSPDLSQLSTPELRRLSDLIGKNMVEIPTP